MSAENLAAVESIYALHEEGDVRGIGEVFAEDVVWHAAESYPYASPDGPWRGREQVLRNVTEAIPRDWIGFTTRVDEIIDLDDRVIVLGRYRGRHRGTGRDLDAQVCAIYDVQGGRVTRFRQYTDTAQIRAAMGCSFPSAEPS
jgi:ketosteroid isomerase-like protein